jgi:hypothetical protein
MAIKFADLLNAFEFADFDSGAGPFNAYICRRTGRIYLQHEDDDAFNALEELPEDIDDPRKYLPLPHSRALGLTKPLALAFAREHLAEDYHAVRDIFSRRGAFGAFQNLLARRDALKAWYAYRDAAQKEALRAWAAENEIALED